MPAEVTVYIIQNESVLSSISQTMVCSGCIKVPAPKDCITGKYELVVKIRSTFYKYTSPKKPTFIRCKSRSSITFIQTDKPIYKAGQKVRFRILSVSLPKLTPVVEDIARIYMETPGSNRVLQKDDVTTTLGLAELDFQLDTHPPLGTWKIYVENSAGKHTQEFKVDEFVLPKWSVTIEAPTSVLAIGSATFKICAKYTYGEAVQGNYSGQISTTGWNVNNILDTISFSGQINEDQSGCVTLSVDSSDLKEFSSWRYLIAKASVTESVSGITRKATSGKIRIKPFYYGMKFDDETTYYFKLGSPIPGRVLVNRDSESTSGIRVTIEITTYNYNGRVTLYSSTESTDEEGAVQFLIPTDDFPENITHVGLKARTGKLTAYRSLQGWYSESKHFVTIVPPFKSVPCTGCYSFRIYHNAQPGTLLRYMILSKGYVVLTGAEYIPGTFPFFFHLFDTEKEGYFDMDLTMTPLLSGEATMLVYYVTPSLEFIADFVKFNVDECFLNEVTFEFDKDQGEPGDQMMYTLSSASDSLCGIGVIDRSLELLAGNSFILKKQVFQLLKKMNLRFSWDQFDTNEYCHEKQNESEEPKDEDDKSRDEKKVPARHTYTYYYSKYVDSSIALNNIGVYAMSDLVLQTRPCDKRRLYAYRQGSENSMSFSRSGEEQPLRAPAENAPKEEEKEEEEEEEEEEFVDIRKFFPETFLWKLIVIPKSGSFNESVTLSDTITEWYGNAVCTNQDVGLGISDFTSITTFQTFFIQLNLPYSIIRGETVHIPVLLFNYLNNDQCLVVNIKMTEQPTFDIEGPKEYTVCSCGHQSQLVKFSITPNIIGEITLTVVAITVKSKTICDGPVASTSASDGVSRTLLVKPEGIEIAYSFSRFLCSPVSISAELPLPDQFVEGSERGQLSVIGDIMGPALSNLDRLIRMPRGCGEQTIYLTGQSAIILKYLDVTGQSTPKIKSKAIRSMSSGYQRELTFKHPNGAYSAWGPKRYRSSSGSNWLTAYVVRVFALSDEYIFIDPTEQQVSLNFLESGQQNDGCFPQIGSVIHKGMQGGLVGGNKPIALTGFILISLLEAGRSPTSQSVKAAIDCLGAQSLTGMSTYALALSAYAYTLYGEDSARRQQLINELENRAIVEDGQKYWSESTGTSYGECRWYCRHPSYDVEMTAYVLLAIVSAGGPNDIGDGLPIVRWLTSQRNAYGGWTSTQDTFVGLEALYKYSTLVAGDAMDVNVVITPPGVTFNVDSSNKQILQTSPIDVPNNISISVNGQGCAFVQASVWYNIIPPVPKKPFFNIDLNIVPTRICARQSVDICVSYLRDDGPTNMALVQMKLVTGWEVSEDSIPQLGGPTTNNTESDDSPGTMTKIEFEDDMVIFYFDKLSSSASCFEFQLIQEIKVNNAKPGFVTVFDYYDTNKETSIDYTLSCN